VTVEGCVHTDRVMTCALERRHRDGGCADPGREGASPHQQRHRCHRRRRRKRASSCHLTNARLHGRRSASPCRILGDIFCVLRLAAEGTGRGKVAGSGRPW
jgi:hypothetical protein